MNIMMTAMPAIYQAAGSLPPGMGQLTTLISWATGLAGVACLAGFVLAMGKTGLQALAHGQFQGGMGAVICLVCAVGLGASSAIFAALGISA